jgi:hypothetical protein
MKICEKLPIAVFGAIYFRNQMTIEIESSNL